MTIKIQTSILTSTYILQGTTCLLGMSWIEVHEALPLTVVHLINVYKTSLYSDPISLERPRTTGRHNNSQPLPPAA